MPSSPRIICLDDDDTIRKTITANLALKGYEVHEASTEEEFYNTIETNKIDLALIDLLMPDIDGISLLKDFRKTHNTPVIMISGRSEYIDKIMGIEAGADDYLTKPFSHDELEVRIRAILRRVNNKVTNEDNHQRLYFGDYIYDPSTYQVLTTNEETIGLTTSEFFLLQLLIVNHGRAVTREKSYKSSNKTATTSMTEL